LLEADNLGEPARVPLGLGEACLEKRTDELFGERRPHDTSTETENVHRIVLDTLARREGIVAKRGANAAEFVGGDGSTNAAAANEHAPIGLALANRLRHALGVIGIVVA